MIAAISLWVERISFTPESYRRRPQSVRARDVDRLRAAIGLVQRWKHCWTPSTSTR